MATMQRQAIEAATTIEAAVEEVRDAAALLRALAHHDGEVEFDPRGLAMIATALSAAADAISAAGEREVSA